MLMSWPVYDSDCKKAKANLIECIFHCECNLAKSLTYCSLGFSCLVIPAWFRTQSAQRNILRGCSRCLACIPLPRAAPSHWDHWQRSQGSTEDRAHPLALHRGSTWPMALPHCSAALPWSHEPGSCAGSQEVLSTAQLCPWGRGMSTVWQDPALVGFPPQEDLLTHTASQRHAEGLWRE